MEFNSKKYFEDFLNNNLRPDNAEKIYDMFWKFETDEEILFKNCCKILGIDRDELLYKFDMSVLVDGDMGLTSVALGERFGTIEFDDPDDPDNPSYSTLTDIVFDDNNSEYISVRQKIYQSAVREMIKNYDEQEYDTNDILGIIQSIGAFNHIEKVEKQEKLAEQNSRKDDEIGKPPVRSPIGVEIGNSGEKGIGSFGTPLPQSAEAIQYYLFDIGVTDWKDIVFERIVSSVPGLGDLLMEIIAKEDVSPHRVNEINYLAVKLQELNEEGFAAFASKIESGYDDGHSYGSITDIINLAIISAVPQDIIYKGTKNIIDKGTKDIVSQGAQGASANSAYQEPEGIPAEHIVYSPHLPQLVMLKDVELPEALMMMHTLGGDYLKDSAKNLSLLLENENASNENASNENAGNDFLLLMDGTNLHLSETMSVYQQGTPEHRIWKNAIQSPETRAFAVVLSGKNHDDFAYNSNDDFVDSGQDDFADGDEGDVNINGNIKVNIGVSINRGIRGSIIEIDFSAQQHDIVQNSIVPQHAQIGVSELKELEVHLQTVRSGWNESPPAVQRIPISTREFRAEINENYMSQLKHPDRLMLRIAPEAAKELVVIGDTTVYRMNSSEPKPLYHLEAMRVVRSSRSSPEHGFAIDKLYDGNFNKWVKHRVGEVVRQMERSEYSKAKGKSEEL